MDRQTDGRGKAAEGQTDVEVEIVFRFNNPSSFSFLHIGIFNQFLEMIKNINAFPHFKLVLGNKGVKVLLKEQSLKTIFMSKQNPIDLQRVICKHLKW